MYISLERDSMVRKELSYSILKLSVTTISSLIILLQSVVITANKTENVNVGRPVYPPPCPSNIYCQGELLHAVQMTKVYDDSKEYVDLKMKRNESEILKNFELLKGNKTIDELTRDDMKKFVLENFDDVGSEFETWIPDDWKKEPKLLKKIKDIKLRKFASDLNDIWKMLGKKMKNDVKLNQHLYSIIYVDNPVIVPGGRFREFYYWDSYWIMKGLLLSEMFHTVRGMLNNFVSIVDRIGFIPNGGRIYYTMRSQPPMLIQMVKIYLDASNDTKWLKENLWLLEKEFHFWMTNRTVTITKGNRNYTLARYCESSNGPRPESYREDYLNGASFRTTEEKNEYYRELKTAAESGWDFSSRWFILNGTNKGNLTNTKARSIIPVDLNALIYGNAVLLGEFYEKLGNLNKAEEYVKIAKEWKEAVNAILWHDEIGVWFDYDIHNDIKRDYFYPTNVLPLWTNCYDTSNREFYISKVLKYLANSQTMVFLGGIPTTLEHSTEQWDYPNAWPPLQYFVIMSLDNSGDKWAKRLAYELSEKWVQSNFKAFNATSSMFEKYDATISGGDGGGGEYEVQLGFGWSNGLVLDLLNKYGNQLTAENKFTRDKEAKKSEKINNAAIDTLNFLTSNSVSTAGQMMTGVLALIISIAAGFIG